MTIKIDDINLRKTFDCGQCFRWNKIDGSANTYIGVVESSLVTAAQTADGACFSVISGDVSADFLENYFDKALDYNLMRREIIQNADCFSDDFMKDATIHSEGMRLLRQDPFETLISFIISANNNIPKIKMCVEDLCTRFGTKIELSKDAKKQLKKLGGGLSEKDYYSFPSPMQLSEAGLDKIAMIRAIGYRARGVYEASQKVAEGDLDLASICKNENLKGKKSCACNILDAMGRLKALYGVGEKVANCVALFGLGHREAFPIDTWVKKTLTEIYGIKKDFSKFVEKRFTVHPGLSQQFMFFYQRELKQGLAKR